MNDIKSENVRDLAQAQFKEGKYDLAQKSWEKVTESSDDFVDWFNLATSATMNNSFEIGAKAFDESMRLMASKNEPSASVVELTYYYIKALVDAKQWEPAFVRLNSLVPFYTISGVTDLTSLSASLGGIVPSFEDFVGTANEILQNIDKGESSGWFEDLSSKVDDDGKNVIASIQG